jgi:hypothetical protein
MFVGGTGIRHRVPWASKQILRRDRSDEPRWELLLAG